MLRLLWFSAVVIAVISTCQAYTDFDECNTPQCDIVAHKLDKRLDYKVHPCDDFRKHTCGSGYKAENNKEWSVTQGFDQLYTIESNDVNIFRNILENTLSTSNVKLKLKSLDIERDIFKSCTKYGVRTPVDERQYKQNLPEKVKNLEHPEANTRGGNEHWVSSDKYFAERGYGYAFFDLKIVETFDMVRSKSRYIQLSAPTDNIMDIRAFLSEKYDKLAHRVLIAFIEDLNKIITQGKSSTADERNLNSSELFTIADWDVKWAGQTKNRNTARIEWERTIRELFYKAGLEAPPSNTEIIVKDEKYFSDLAELLSKNNVNTIENYVNLRYVSKTIGLVNSEHIGNSLVPSINKLICVPGLFVGTAHAYARMHFTRDNQQKLKVIFDEVRKNIIDRLGRHNGVTNNEATRVFLQKLSTANVMFGYPEWLLNENVVANLYPERMVINERYFGNEEVAYISLHKYNLRALRNYSLPIIDINQLFKAFTSDKIEVFEHDTNDIVIPVRVFSEANFPFFSALLYDPMNYGSAATVLATEIYYKWLNIREITQSNVTDCINNLVTPGSVQNQTEEFKRRATAYLLGVRTAYKAWPYKNLYPILFPRFGAIHDTRLFFLSFAETLCDSKMTTDDLMGFNKQIFPVHFINVVLTNLKEYQETFVCDDSRKMTRKYKCDPLGEEEEEEES